MAVVVVVAVVALSERHCTSLRGPLRLMCVRLRACVRTRVRACTELSHSYYKYSYIYIE